MQSLPDLNELSHAQKDELIHRLWPLEELGQELVKRVNAMQEIIDDLQGRLALNSKNSSKPPSSDGLNKSKPKPKSLRVAGKKSTGGQKGHTGSTLLQVAQPDEVVTHDVPDRCAACQRSLDFAYVGETRQVFDLPALRFQVTEHRAMQAVCSCGQVHSGQFPIGVNATVQYGALAQAAMVHLNQNHAVPLQRTAALMQQLFGLQVSQAAVCKANLAAKEALAPTVQRIGQACVSAPVLSADETGMRVAKTLHWLHVLATPTLSWIGSHPKRGTEAFEALGLLQQFRGVLVHDGWMPYKALDCAHALCNAHHLRELTYLFEEQEQAWASDMIELLSHANHTDNQNCAEENTVHYGTAKYKTEVRDLRHLYDAILTHAELTNPIEEPSGKRGRTKQSKAVNLIGRLRQYSDDVWRFMSAPDIPFTNNLAEQAVRMPKVKQKVSGCFRTSEGAHTYCVIRSYAATLHKQGIDVFEALVSTFKGEVPQPSFG